MKSNDKVKELLNNLLKAEKNEKQLVSIYAMILDFGVDNCIDVDQLEECRRDLLMLRNESERHKRLLKETIAETNNFFKLNSLN